MKKEEKSSADVRCGCDRLLARRTHDGYELKCGRCKAVWLLPQDITDQPMLLHSAQRRA